MGSVEVASAPALHSLRYSHCQLNFTDPNERRMIRSALPKRQTTNPFFFRNNPHPSRVRHIKGLLDNPVCTVMDSGYRDGGSNMTNEVLLDVVKSCNLTLQKRETFVPGIGIVNIQPTWVEQLQLLTSKVDLNENLVTKQQTNTRPLSRQAARTTPPRLFEKRQLEEAFVRQTCSREGNVGDAFGRKTFSRGGRERAGKENDVGLTQKDLCKSLPRNITLNESEMNVARLLSQILRTDSLDVIRHWLMEAPDKEKEVVLEMLRAVSASNLQYRQVMNQLNTNKTEAQAAGEQEEDVKGCTKTSPHPCLNATRAVSREKETSPRAVSLEKETSPRAASRENETSPRAVPREKEVSPRTVSRGRDCTLLDVIKENLEADMNASRLSSRLRRSSKEPMFPNIHREDAEIDALRSQLASRSNIDVFPRKSSRSSAR